LNHWRENIPKILAELDEDLEVRWMEAEYLFAEAEFRIVIKAAHSVSIPIFKEYQNAVYKPASLDSDKSEIQSQTLTSNLKLKDQK
jgi:hypothetical protein